MRSIIEIDLNVLEENYTAIYNYLKKPIIAVVKSNAYGHGLVPITNALIHMGVTSFAVATLEEAIILRRNFNSITIILLEPSTEFSKLFSYRITLSVSSMSYLKKVIESNLYFPIHLKLETGLNRLGIYSSQLNECIKILEKSKLSIKGVYTHISSENDYQSQLYLFKKMIIPFNDINNLQIHISSSHYLVPDGISTHYRIGLALYGLCETNVVNLKPILTLKSPIYRVKKVSKNESVGYYNLGKISEEGYIYTIPLGYADGWIQSRVTIAYHDNYLKQVGQTCMDLMMLYSPKYIKENEMIEIISPNLNIFELSRYYNESIYQIVTLLSPRIERKYIK